MYAATQQKQLNENFCTILIDTNNTVEYIDEEQLDTNYAVNLTDDDEETLIKEEHIYEDFDILLEEEEEGFLCLDSVKTESQSEAGDESYGELDEEALEHSAEEEDEGENESQETEEEEFIPAKRRKATEKIDDIVEVEVIDDIMNLNDEEFQKTFQIRRNTIGELVTDYATSQQFMHNSPKGLTAEFEILIYIYYLTHSATLQHIAQKFNIHIQSLRRIIRRCMDYIATEKHDYIKWPSDLKKASKDFAVIANMPGVIGAIACTNVMLTHTKIRENRLLYYNSKLNAYSSRIFGIFDAQGKFTKVFIGAPGSYSNSKLLNETNIVKDAQERERRFGTYYILGDETFPCSSWLIKPFEYSNSNAIVEFNELHAKTRSPAELSMMLFRKRFANVLNFADYFNFNYMNKLLLSACILHNMFIDKHDDLLQLNDEEIAACSACMSDDDVDEELEFVEESTKRRKQLFDVLIKYQVIKE